MIKKQLVNHENNQNLENLMVNYKILYFFEVIIQPLYNRNVNYENR